MSLPESILFATGNPHKLQEVSAILSQLGVRVAGLADIGKTIAEPEETGDTFESNAALKALYYSSAAGMMALADDSGLEVDALGGEPGVISARYAGVSGPRSVVDPANNAKLIGKLKGIAPERRTARFVCALALAEGGRILTATRGTVEGLMITEPRGANGFGYDPLFYLPELKVTSAELPPEKKNALSHRGNALRAMMAELRRIKASAGR